MVRKRRRKACRWYSKCFS